MGLWLVVLWIVVFGIIGALIAPRKGWTSIGGFVLSATFGIFGVAYLATREDIDPTLTPTSAAGPPSTAPRSGSVADRLRELEDLADEGVITEDEYDEKRAALMARL